MCYVSTEVGAIVIMTTEADWEDLEYQSARGGLGMTGSEAWPPPSGHPACSAISSHKDAGSWGLMRLDSCWSLQGTFSTVNTLGQEAAVSPQRGG